MKRRISRAEYGRIFQTQRAAAKRHLDARLRAEACAEVFETCWNSAAKRAVFYRNARDKAVLDTVAALDDRDYWRETALHFAKKFMAADERAHQLQDRLDVTIEEGREMAESADSWKASYESANDEANKWWMKFMERDARV